MFMRLKIFLTSSADAIYNPIITATASRKYPDILVKPKGSDRGVNGKMTVKRPTKSVTTINDLLGLEEKNGLLVRIISTIIEAEITDSMNQPVRN